MTLIATLIGASIVIFIVMEILPGDPALVILGVDASPEAVQALTTQLGLDRPPVERYWAWISGLLQGELGNSYAYKVPVSELIEGALLVTVPLAFLAITLSIILALVIGLYAAANHNKLGDVTLMGISQLGISVPNFWLAILLIILFAIELRWLPSGGFPGWSEGIWPNIRAMILPSVALATVVGAILARITRSSVLEVFREDYVRTARAKGLPPARIVGVHALRNAMIPVITTIGLQIGVLMAGAILTETIFSWPGIGKWMIDSISRRDYPVVQSGLLLIAGLVMMVNLIVDLTYGLINPRIRHK